MSESALEKILTPPAFWELCFCLMLLLPLSTILIFIIKMNQRTWKKQNSNPSAQFFVCITFGRKLKAINGNEYVCGFYLWRIYSRQHRRGIKRDAFLPGPCCPMKELCMLVSNFRNMINVINEVCQVIRSLESTDSASFSLSLPISLYCRFRGLLYCHCLNDNLLWVWEGHQP